MTYPKKQLWFYDRWILLPTLALSIIGLLMVASASMVISDRQFGCPLHFFLRQMIYFFVGLMTAWLITRIPIRVWMKCSPMLLLACIFLLIAVLIPGIGKIVNGSRRWIYCGFFSLQVSELVKLGAILYLSSYLQRHAEQVTLQLKGFLKPMMIAVFLAGLLLLQPDFGAASVIIMTYLALLFIAGVRIWPFFILLLLVIVAMSLLAVLSPYRLQRLLTFLHPWINQFGSGYQLTQSLIAFGRGGIFGVGLGNSIQKLFYLPEAHTDFLFAVLAEELGLIGALFVIGLFVVLVGRMFIVARAALRHQQLFAAYYAYAVAMWISLQLLINLGVNIGLLPTKGLTLPFMSYGGSSLLVNCIAIGMMLRVSFEITVGSGASKSKRNHITRY